MRLLVDCHAHMDHRIFEKDIDEVIKRAKESGVKSIISNGIDKITNRKTLVLSKKYPLIKAALGIYPPKAHENDAKNNPEIEYESFNINDEINFIRKNKNNIIAIGEIGLEYKDTDDRIEQQIVFEKMLNLSKEIEKTVIVHSRKAEKEVVETLERLEIKKVILHCFSGKIKIAKKAIELGYYFSIPTCVIRSQQFQEFIKIIPLKQILTETDSPFLSPFIGKRNEPIFIKESIKKIAEIKKIEEEEVERIIFMNYRKLFGV
jgi:TatD DNase family protein